MFFDDPEAAFANLARWVAPGGRFAFEADRVACEQPAGRVDVQEIAVARRLLDADLLRQHAAARREAFPGLDAARRRHDVDATGRRLPDDPIFDFAPDLAVEVLSESNTPEEMERKLGEYFLAGVRLVWMIDPAKRTAMRRAFAAQQKQRA